MRHPGIKAKVCVLKFKLLILLLAKRTLSPVQRLREEKVFHDSNDFDSAFAAEPTNDMIAQALVDGIANGTLCLSESELDLTEDDSE